ncbi:hypothetical protein [Gluconacetobacter aggeris]|nr:hypothetical protein [Gluconacetobacter aggeris]
MILLSSVQALEMVMSHRSIGQDYLEFSRMDRGPSSLDQIAALLDW